MGMRDRKETRTEGDRDRRKPGDTEMWGRWKISWKSNSNG
jgi:acyl-CoA-binding protein